MSLSWMFRLSVVAQNVTLAITAGAGNEIVEIYHDRMQLMDGIYQLQLGDMYAEGKLASEIHLLRVVTCTNLTMVPF